MIFFVLHNFQTSYLGVVHNVFMFVPGIHSSLGIRTHVTAHYTAACRMMISRITLQVCRSHDIMNRIYFLWRKTCKKKEFNILYLNCNHQLDFLCEKKELPQNQEYYTDQVPGILCRYIREYSTVQRLIPHVQLFGVSIDFGQSMFCNFVKY